MSHVLQQCFERIMGAYEQARAQDGFTQGHPISAQFEELKLLLEQHAHGTGREQLQVEWSVGKGNWASVPWIAIFDERETLKARDGVYISYLFREDMSAVYATLVHGTLALVNEHGTKKAYEVLAQRIKAARVQVQWLKRAGFTMDQGVALRSTSKLARDYEHGVIAYKRYDLNRMPKDAQIIADLDELCDAYESYVDGEQGISARAWCLALDEPQLTSHELPSEQTVQLRAKDEAPQVGDRLFLYGARQPQQPSSVWGVARLERVAATKKRREYVLGFAEVEVWPEALEPEAFEALFSEALPELPASRRPLVLWDAGVELALLSWQQEHGARFELSRAVGQLRLSLERQGWRFEPWLIAAYLTALKTKPFVILAGVSGTGKSKLPALICEHISGRLTRQPVRPDWTDSAEILGYVDLEGRFRPGTLLKEAQRAMSEDDEQHHVFLLDEMNLARVEQYLAEFLSAIEDRRPEPAGAGGFKTSRLLGIGEAVDAQGRDWSAVYMPGRMAIVGTVNMDETTFGFSKKVLDRAFTLEMPPAALTPWRQGLSAAQALPRAHRWPAAALMPRATRLAELELEALSAQELACIDEAVEALEQANKVLGPAQLQIGYRVRDEIALFVLHARELAPHFVDAQGQRVSALDLALAMKLLPRIVGGSTLVRRALMGLIAWASSEAGASEDEEALVQEVLATWRASGRPWALPSARWPHCCSRLLMMWERLLDEGYTSYWI